MNLVVLFMRIPMFISVSTPMPISAVNCFSTLWSVMKIGGSDQVIERMKGKERLNRGHGRGKREKREAGTEE